MTNNSLSETCNEIVFSDFFKKHAKSLRNFLFYKYGNKDQAEDLVQETMLKAFKNKDKFAPDTNLKGWLYTILKNLFINEYRKKVKRKVIHDDTENNYLLEID